MVHRVALQCQAAVGASRRSLSLRVAAPVQLGGKQQAGCSPLCGHHLHLFVIPLEAGTLGSVAHWNQMRK